MAYLYEITTRCQQEGCTKPRSHRVCNARNDTMGEFCKRHAEARLRSLQATEDKLNAAARKSRLGDQ